MTLDGVSAHCPFWVHTSAWTGTPSIRPFIPADVARKPAEEIEKWAEEYLLRLLGEFPDSLALRRQPGTGKESLKPSAGQDCAAVQCMFVGQFLAVACADDLGSRVMPQQEGDKSD